VRGSWGFLKRMPVSRRPLPVKGPAAPCAALWRRSHSAAGRIRAADSLWRCVTHIARSC